MNSLIGELHAPGSSTYLYKIEWDVVALLKSKIESQAFSPTSEFLEPPVFDGKLFSASTENSRVSEEFMSTRELAEFTCGHTLLTCRFHIASHPLAATPQISLSAKLECDTDFIVRSASVSYRHYYRTESTILSYYCDQREPLTRLDLTNQVGRNRQTSRAGADCSDGKWKKWVEVYLDPELANFKSLIFNFEISPCGFILVHEDEDSESKYNISDRSKCLYPSFLFSPDYSDVSISCGAKEYSAHKFVICSKSKVLDRMFVKPIGSAMIEASTGKMNMDDAEPEIVEEFLRFLYTGDVEDLAKNAAGLLIIADKYDVQDLKSMSEKAILNSTTDANVLKLYELGNLVGSEPIIRQCVERIKINKKSIWKSAEEVDKSCKKHPELLRKVLGLNFSMPPDKARKVAQNGENRGNGNRSGGGGGKKQRTE